MKIKVDAVARSNDREVVEAICRNSPGSLWMLQDLIKPMRSALHWICTFHSQGSPMYKATFTGG
jgi:hypothetical protein